MAGIKRFITYIYAYENGVKGMNAGFAKVEIRGNECRIEVHLRGIPIRMETDEVYLFKEEEGQILAFPMGEMRMIKGSGDYGTIIKADQIGGSEYSFAQMEGMVFTNKEGTIAMTRWAEGKPLTVTAENIRRWEPPKLDEEELHATEMPMRNIFPKFVWGDLWERLKGTYPYFTLPGDEAVECVREHFTAAQYHAYMYSRNPQTFGLQFQVLLFLVHFL